LQFATADATTITIWEVGFISGGTPAEVKTLPAPDNFGSIISAVEHPDHMTVQFLPTPCLLSFAHRGRVLVWDIWNSRCLLDYTDISPHPETTFSSDDCFFACTTSGNIHLWKKSPTDYILHRIPAPKAEHFSKPLFSHGGESTAVCSNHMIWSGTQIVLPPTLPIF
jgi:hypothetical protein